MTYARNQLSRAVRVEFFYLNEVDYVLICADQLELANTKKYHIEWSSL